MRFARLIVFSLLGLCLQTTQVQAAGEVVSTVVNPDQQILSRVGDTNVIRVQVRDQFGKPFPFAWLCLLLFKRHLKLNFRIC